MIHDILEDRDGLYYALSVPESPASTRTAPEGSKGRVQGYGVSGAGQGVKKGITPIGGGGHVIHKVPQDIC